MICGIHHIAIHTRNLARIVEFYRNALGFHVASEGFDWEDNEFVDSVIGVPGSAARSVMLSGRNIYVEVFEYFAPPPRGGGPLRPHDLGYTHFALDTDDIEADYERLLSAGMTFVRNLPDALGGIRSVYGKDPDGNIIELQQLAKDHELSLGRLGVA